MSNTTQYEKDIITTIHNHYEELIFGILAKKRNIYKLNRTKGTTHPIPDLLVKDEKGHITRNWK